MKNAEQKALDLNFIRGTVIRILITCTVIFSVIGYGAFTYWRTYTTMTEAEIAEKRSIVNLAAIVIKERLERLGWLADSFATRPKVIEDVAAGNWDGAIDSLKNVPHDFPIAIRVLLADVNGIVKADLPAIPGYRGQDRSGKDWFKGAMRTGAPYVSEVYLRPAEPRFNIIAISTPIRRYAADELDPAGTPGGGTIGVFMFQISLETFRSWGRILQRQDEGNVYFVDKNGSVIYHPDYPSSRIVDLSKIPAVCRALAGQRGSDIMTDPATHRNILTVYEPVRPYGWGVVISEPADAAFGPRDGSLRSIVIWYTISVLFLLAVAALLFYIEHLQRLNELRLKDLNVGLERKVEARTRELLETSKECSDAHDLLQSIIEGSEESVVALDMEMKFIAFNTAYRKEFERLFGKKIELGMSIAVALEHLPEVRERMIALWRRSLSRETFTMVERYGEAPLERRYLEMRSSPIKGDSNLLVGAAHIVRDITARVIDENRLKDHLKDLSEFRHAAIDREDRMIELKKEINALSIALGRTPPHDLSFLKEGTHGTGA